MSATSRRFRVARNTPGVDWSEWRYTYHPTREAAEAKARAFLRGEEVRTARAMTGHSAYRQRKSWATIGERVERYGGAAYQTVATINPDGQVGELEGDSPTGSIITSTPEEQ